MHHRGLCETGYVRCTTLYQIHPPYRILKLARRRCLSARFVITHRHISDKKRKRQVIRISTCNDPTTPSLTNGKSGPSAAPSRHPPRPMTSSTSTSTLSALLRHRQRLYRANTTGNALDPAEVEATRLTTAEGVTMDENGWVQVLITPVRRTLF